MEPTPRGRRRLLAVWSALSTPLILALIGVAFLPGNLAIIGSALLGIFIVFAVEAIARGNFFRYVLTLAGLAVIVVVGTTVAGLTVYFGWQTTVAVCFFVLAFFLVVNNLRELTRD